MSKPLLYFLLSLLVAAPRLRAQLLPIRNYTTREGLNANSITAILRDSRGMLWIGTYNGVNWYDGARFLQPPMTTHSGQIYVTHFLEDRRGDIWIATWYSGLYKYAKGTFSNYLPDPEHISNQANSITCLVQLDSSLYLIGTDHNALLFDGRHFSLLDPGNPLLNQQIHSVICTSGGEILIGLPQGVACYRKVLSTPIPQTDPSTPQPDLPFPKPAPPSSGPAPPIPQHAPSAPQPAPPSSNPAPPSSTPAPSPNPRWKYTGLLLKGTDINQMALHNGHLWITCYRGLYYCSSITATPRLLISGPVDNVFPQSSHDCWYTEGSIGACLLHDGIPIRRLSKDNGLPSSFVRTVYTDTEGITWLGTEYGLAKLTLAGYSFFPIQEDAASDANIIAIEKDTSGTLWLGTFYGLYHMQGNTPVEVRPPGGARCGFVFRLLRDHRGRMWACTGTGIYTIDNNRPHRQDTRTASSLAEDDNGTLWFGCADGRILRHDETGFREMSQTPLIDQRIPGIYNDKEGFLWVGYALAGIRKYRIAHDSLRLVQQFPNDSGQLLLVRAMHGDGLGHLLVGTRTGGLYVFGSSNLIGAPLTMEQGLSGNWIKGIASGNGKILLATNNGLDILEEGHYPYPVRHIPFNDDRVPSEFNTVCLHHDTVWVGAGSGLLEYVPRNQLPGSLPPAVYTMRAVINGRTDSSFTPFSQDSRLPPLDHARNNLSFDFAGLSFLDESAVRYRYRLEGVDKDWSPPTDRRYVNYGNLPPGDYRFLVIAAGDDGLWSTRPASIAFTIAAPFWRTPWFLTLCTLTILSLAYVLYRLRLHQVLKIERLRHRISTDLHDDMGSTLSSISILSDMALQEEEAARSIQVAPPLAPALPSPVTPALPVMIKEIRDNSLSLLEKMDDIVWSINPRNDTLESLMLRVRRFGAQLFEARGIEYDIDIEPHIRHLRLRMNHRQDLYLIMKEAIINLVKYAKAAKARIQIQSIRHHLVLRISDDGVGFIRDAGHTGNGIINMQNRAAAMKAALDIDTAPGRGTTVTLTLKIT